MFAESTNNSTCEENFDHEFEDLSSLKSQCREDSMFFLFAEDNGFMKINKFLNGSYS
jgi:hypothetical protein